jgi:lycopene cyclase CruA
MKQLLYLEVPTAKTEAVKQWLRQQFIPQSGKIKSAPEGIFWQADPSSLDRGDRDHQASNQAVNPASNQTEGLLSIFVWSLQHTTYLKVFRWSDSVGVGEQKLLADLTNSLRLAFPHIYEPPPEILPGQSIYEALSDRYPLTVEYFQKFDKGETDLQRVYWWEKRWRESVSQPQLPKQVVFADSERKTEPEYDLIYIGGALGALHGAMMAKLGYRVCLIERLGFGRMNREWNISRAEFDGLVQFGLFSQAEFESMILAEYVDGYNKFFDGNNPIAAKANILHTPKVLNIAIDSSQLLKLCGEKLRANGGEIFEFMEFEQAQVSDRAVTVIARDLSSNNQDDSGSDRSLVDHSRREFHGRLLIDAMGSASAIAQQLNNGKAFDSVCPTVGAVLSGFGPGVWDAQFGDVLNSHGDISRGRQLIWELFPGEGDQVAVYLFHYHQVNRQNPGSLLEMYEDFFAILPEYRRCQMADLTWHKPTFGYIPGHFSLDANSRLVAYDRLLAIGDAAALQSPLVFTGFGSLVRNLPRLTDLLDLALKHDLLKAKDLNQISAYQSNIAVTWLFSKGMMVPTGKFISPERINSMLNTFFGVLADEPAEISDRFIKDRLGWWMFNRLAIVAALKNPSLIIWIWELAGTKDMTRWLRSYLEFSLNAFGNACLAGWLPTLLQKLRPYLDEHNPRLLLKLRSWSYALNYSVGQVGQADQAGQTKL